MKKTTIIALFSAIISFLLYSGSNIIGDVKTSLLFVPYKISDSIGVELNTIAEAMRQNGVYEGSSMDFAMGSGNMFILLVFSYVFGALCIGSIIYGFVKKDTQI